MERKSIKFKGKIVFERVTMTSNFKRVPKLFQEDEACFLYISKGALKFRTPTELLAINEGDALLAKCGNYFIEEVISDNNVETISVFGIYFYPEMIKDFFQTDLSLQHFQNNYDVNRVSVEPLLKSFIESINYLLDHPSLSDENLIANKLKELVLLLGKTDQSIHQFVNLLFTPYEYDFNEIILKNTFTNLSLMELALLCGCSLATFKRKFKKQYNQSPARYLFLKKIEKSAQLLLVPSLPISEIAYDCGFENISSFNKAFKKHFGMSPSQFRKNQMDN